VGIDGGRGEGYGTPGQQSQRRSEMSSKMNTLGEEI